jgi:hypothetical protein
MLRFGTPTQLAVATATVMIAHQVAGKATRDALFLSNFEVTDLPKVTIAAAILSFAAALSIARLLGPLGPTRLVPPMFGFSAFLFLVEWVLIGGHPRAIAVVVYLHMATFGAVLISAFWSVINERFDPHTAKRTIAQIAAAATLGGIIGGLMAERVAHLLELRATLLVLSGLHLICVFGVLGIGKPSGQQADAPDFLGASGFQVMKRTRYLQHMAILMSATAIVAVLLDYALKAAVTERMASGEELVGFFAIFYSVIGVVTFVVQSAFGERALRNLGIGGTLALLPGIVATGGIFGAAFPNLWTATALRGSEAALSNSLFRSGMEQLYTPLAPNQKRPTKAIIDVAFDRVGDLLGSGLIMLLLLVMPVLPNSAVIAAAALCAAGALVIVVSLQRGYIDQLAASLRSGALSIDESDILDATTEHTLAETNVLIDREALLAKIAQLQGDEPATLSAESRDDDELLRNIRALYNGDPDAVREVLLSDELDVHLTPFIIPLVARPELKHDAIWGLRQLAPRVTGQLADVLLDRSQPLLVRRRIPVVLEICENTRAVAGLMAGLEDPEFDVRYRCGQALAQLVGRCPALRVDKKVLFDAVLSELEVSRDQWEAQRLLDDGARPGAATRNGSLNRSLEHVFNLLGLALDLEVVGISLRALYSENPNLRGTALEYLENVLPDDVHSRLWPYLDRHARPPAKRIRRSTQELLKELIQTGTGPESI